MAPSVLLVSTTTTWLGAARIPRGLAGAGFDVTLLTPKGSLAEKSRFVRRIGYLPDDATPMVWVTSLAAMVTATAPRLVIPCDDMSFRLLAELAVAQPPAMQPTMWVRLAGLIRESLGDPAHYQASVDKTSLPALADELGVRVPPWRRIVNLGDAADFLEKQGFPVVLKTRHGFAGQGVAICQNAAALESAWSRFAAMPRVDIRQSEPHECLLQAYIPGRATYYSIAAWKGRLLAGWAAEKLRSNPELTGPGTVARNHRAPEVRSAVERLVGGLGISGLGGSEFIIDERSGKAYLLELSRRITPGTHRGSQLNVDLCVALRSAIDGTPNSSRDSLDDGEEHVYALFPQEWLRDPQSEYLRRGPVDVPWDEPELIEAMLALRHER
jgi:predicted ATP-grasp superfamily ATP-dependent carboligase